MFVCLAIYFAPVLGVEWTELVKLWVAAGVFAIAIALVVRGLDTTTW